MDKMQQDSRKAFEVTVKIHILTLQAISATLSVQGGRDWFPIPPL